MVRSITAGAGKLHANWRYLVTAFLVGNTRVFSVQTNMFTVSLLARHALYGPGLAKPYRREMCIVGHYGHRFSCKELEESGMVHAAEA